MPGPITFSNELARRQLEEYGLCYTFRQRRRTTGETWWRETRLGPKAGDCHVRLEEGPAGPIDEALRPYAWASGFADAAEWRDAIHDIHGTGLGYIYQVRTWDLPSEPCHTGRGGAAHA